MDRKGREPKTSSPSDGIVRGFVFDDGATDMGEKGSKDKGKREEKKKPKRTPKEKRKLQREKKERNK